jgi:alginate O-acetyltransferase complex protein AlgI
MRGYAVPGAEGWVLAGITFCVPVVVGAVFLRARPGQWMRALGWGLVVAAAAGGVHLTRAEPAGNRMLLVCGAVFCALKLIVTAEGRLAGRVMPTFPRWLLFHFGWPGMRPWAFAAEFAGPRPGAARLLVVGLLVTALGAALLLLARAQGTAGPRVVPALFLGLAGLGLTLHFGLFAALAGFWRARGMAVVPLFDAPLRSRSLAEFWGARWNRAFSEMVQIAVERPLARRIGTARATFATFLFSGLLHELALSVPAGAGYGLPLLYFTVHGGLTLLEPRLGIGPLARGPRAWWGNAWATAWVLLPAPILFHPPFLDACIVPLLE